jgi:hypothetical protein
MWKVLSVFAIAGAMAAQGADQVPPPSAEQIRVMFAEMRVNTLNFAWNLPDFLCKQSTRRDSGPAVEKTSGAGAAAEFAWPLHAIFSPENQTSLSWDHWDQVRGRPAAVFSFHTTRPIYKVRDSVTAPVHGQVFLDRETKQILHLHFECEGIPETVTVDQDYDFLDIGGRKFLLPLRSEVHSVQSDHPSRTEITFSGYRVLR